MELIMKDNIIFIEVLVLGALSGFIIGFGVAGLVLVDIVAQSTISERASDSRGLKCLYNCDSFDTVAPKTRLNRTIYLQGSQQKTFNTVQKTQSASNLYRLSDGVEMLPLDMLREGVL